jgi:hypothetical protein
MTGRPQSHDARRAAMAAKVEINANGCHQWNGYILPNGYGQISLDGKSMYAHRASYILHIGPILDGLHVDHKCHNLDKLCRGGTVCLHRRCVNPLHLEVVTQLENNRRAAAKRVTGRRCGHPLDGIRRNGNTFNRYCLTCNRNRANRNYAKELQDDH